MKRFLLVIVMLMLTVPAYGETLLTTPEVRPSIDRYQIERFTIQTDLPRLIIRLRMGYEGFTLVREELISITNADIMRGNKMVYKDDLDGMMMDLPSAYQENPATKIIQEINGGTFGTCDTMKDYLELITKTILGL